MKYFYDLEFKEGLSWNLGHQEPIVDLYSIQPISIAVVCEDGREYYACCMDFDRANSSPWLDENVFPHLPGKDVIFNFMPSPTIKGFKKNRKLHLQTEAWKTNAEIAKDLLLFIDPREITKNDVRTPTQLYGYYSAYDHVALCWFFGTMMQLPPGMPMYTRDLKQEADRLGMPKEFYPPKSEREHDALEDARWNKQLYEQIRIWSNTVAAQQAQLLMI